MRRTPRAPAALPSCDAPRQDHPCRPPWRSCSPATRCSPAAMAAGHSAQSCPVSPPLGTPAVTETARCKPTALQEIVHACSLQTEFVMEGKHGGNLVPRPLHPFPPSCHPPLTALGDVPCNLVQYPSSPLTVSAPRTPFVSATASPLRPPPSPRTAACECHH